MITSTRTRSRSLCKGKSRSAHHTFSTNGETRASILLIVRKHEDETGTTGDGEKALQELVAKYNKVTDEVIRAKMDKLVNSNMKQGEDPHSYFMEKMLARSKLEKIGEAISDRRFKD